MFGKRCSGGKQEKEGAVAASFYGIVARWGGKLATLSVNVARKCHVPQTRQRITGPRTMGAFTCLLRKPVWSRDTVTYCTGTRSASASIDALRASHFTDRSQFVEKTRRRRNTSKQTHISAHTSRTPQRSSSETHTTKTTTGSKPSLLVSKQERWIGIKQKTGSRIRTTTKRTTSAKSVHLDSSQRPLR